MPVPEELKALAQWVCTDRTKVPRMPDGRPASVSDPRTWCRYEDTLAWPYRGLVLTEADPYAVLDIDGRTDWRPLNTYTELSMSGNGIHQVMRWNGPMVNRRTRDWEFYCCRHYVVLTGNGDVLEPEGGVAGIGSGGSYALAAARALMDSDLDAEAIARRALEIAAEICVYTNENLVVETIEGT